MILVNLSQKSKAYMSKLSRLLGNSIVVMPEPLNARPISLIPFSRITFFKVEQLKAPSPIVCTVPGILISV